MRIGDSTHVNTTSKRTETMANHVTTRCTVIGSKPDTSAFCDRMIVWDPRNQKYLDFGFDKLPPETWIETAEGPMKAKMLLENGPPHMRFDFENIAPSPPIVNKVEESASAEHGARLILTRGEYGAAFDTDLDEAFIEEYRSRTCMPDAPMHFVAAGFLIEHPEYEAAGWARLRALVETGYCGWYSWRLANWGTKSNAYSFRLVSEEPLEFLFDTAWNFPSPVFEALAREFPSLRFRCSTFDEMGCFAGEGCFNPGPDEAPFGFCEGTPELYERVYGQKYQPSVAKPKMKRIKLKDIDPKQAE
jgi:hypothetical protein